MLLYISKAFTENMGATMHYEALQELVGKENVFTIDLRPKISEKQNQYICYGKYKSPFDRIHRWMQRNMMFISNIIIYEICDIIASQHVDTVFIEDSVFGNLVKEIKKRFPDVLIMTFYHDIKADLYPQWIKNDNTLISRIEFGIGIRQEKINQKYSDINIVFNQREIRLFEKYYGKTPEAFVPLCTPIPHIPETEKSAISEKGEIKKLLFVGNNFFTNLRGLRWFVDKVLPNLAKNIQVNVVGRGLEEHRNEYSDSRVNIIGSVESLASYYLDTDIVIGPLFDGGGMKTKSVEAMSYGKIYVATKESLVGCWDEMNDIIRNKIVFRSDDAKEWVSIINSLVDSDIKKFNFEVYDLFVKKFSYGAVRDQLAALLKDGGKVV